MQHSDGTKRRQIDIQNSVLLIAKNGGFKNIVLDSAIMSECETVPLLNQAIQRTFKEGGERLDSWRKVTEREYPGRPDLLEMISLATEFTLTELARKGWIMTDTCNPARAFRRNLKASIQEIALDAGMRIENICIFRRTVSTTFKMCGLIESQLNLGNGCVMFFLMICQRYITQFVRRQML